MVRSFSTKAFFFTVAVEVLVPPLPALTAALPATPCVAAQVEFESKASFERQFCHFLGSRVEARRLSSYGSSNYCTRLVQAPPLQHGRARVPPVFKGGYARLVQQPRLAAVTTITAITAFDTSTTAAARSLLVD
jgi:hypothetical protein